MFLPLYPQGPVYHWPVATFLLIVANLVGFALQMANNEPRYKEMTLPASKVLKDPELARQFPEVAPGDEITLVLEV
jgi:hypothetical protein